MNLKAKVKYISKNGKPRSYFFKRAIRAMSNGSLGVNIYGTVYPLYKGDFIDHQDKRKLPLKECPKLARKEAEEKYKKLPFLKPFSETDLYDVKFTVKEVIDYEDKPDFSFPKYERDWFLEKRDTGIYITINESNNRLDKIKAIINKPRNYSCIDMGGQRFTMQAQANEIGDAVMPKEVTAFNSPSPIRDYFKPKQRSFFDRYGEFDFFISESFKPAPNGIQYDYFFRFDPTVSEQLLKDMFEDILRVSEACDLVGGIDAFLIHDDDEEDQNNNIGELNKKLEILNSERSQSDEIANLYAKESEAIKSAFDSLDNKYKKLSRKHEDIQKKLAKAKRQIITQFERNMSRYQNINLLPRGLKAVDKYFEDTNKLEDIIYKIHSNDSYISYKNVQKTKHWKEVTQKISNGYDNQGRVYSCIVDNQKIILVGHKQEQSEDIDYLIKNDPPNLES